MEREKDGWSHSSMVEMLAVGPRPPWRTARRRGGAWSQRSVSAQAMVIFSGEFRQQAMVRGEWTRGYNCWASVAAHERKPPNDQTFSL
jgi:hypothetical protein